MTAAGLGPWPARPPESFERDPSSSHYCSQDLGNGHPDFPEVMRLLSFLCSAKKAWGLDIQDICCKGQGSKFSGRLLPPAHCGVGLIPPKCSSHLVSVHCGCYQDHPRTISSVQEFLGAKGSLGSHLPLWSEQEWGGKGSARTPCTWEASPEQHVAAGELGDMAEPGWSSWHTAESGTLHLFTVFVMDLLSCINNFSIIWAAGTFQKTTKVLIFPRVVCLLTSVHLSETPARLLCPLSCSECEKLSRFERTLA